MPDLNDMDLIRDYADEHSERAFAELVRRHVNLVYSVALRHVGNAADAQDVAQAVFIVLANKAASLRHRSALTGWLYETTRFTATRLLRTRTRQQARDHEAHMQTTLNEPDPEGVWRQLAPHLEAAMSRLGERDRTLLALRFFENKTTPEAAAALGINEAAAQKRASRALDRLRKFFLQRGLALSATAIAGAISAHSVQAAPAGLANTLATVALAKGAAAGGSTLTLVKGVLKLMAWTKAKVAVVTGVAVILTTGTGLVVIREASRRPPHLPPGGLPQTLAELNAWYVTPPAGQNAATCHLQGFQAMQLGGADKSADLPVLGKAPLPAPGTLLPPAMKSALETFVDANRQALQYFAQGAQCEQSRYPVDFTLGERLQLPHLAKVKSASQLAQMAAVLAAENHDGKQAAEDVLLILALARSLNAEPMLIPQMVRVASAGGLAVAALEQVVNRTPLPPESQGALAKAFQNMADYDAQGEGFNRSLIGETVMTTATFKKLKPQELPTMAADGTTEEQRQQFERLLAQPGGMKMEKDYLDKAFAQLLAARKEAFPERLEHAAERVERATAAANGVLLLNNAWLTGYTNLVSLEAKCLAYDRVALTALALEQFRADHKSKYPAQLSELAPNYLEAVPVDPFDGQPLRYRPQGAGYVLYSIGPDLKDDGGTRLKGKMGDLVFAVVTPQSVHE